jgi:hypothetical protein
MARLTVHKLDCVYYLGQGFEEVHRWLDEYAKQYPVEVFEDQHRSFRHNKEGVEEVRKKWGDRAADAARLHIARDELGEFPKTFKIGEKDES